MEWPSGRWRAPAAEMGPQQQFSTTQSCICWHIFLLVIFCFFFTQIFRHSEVYHLEKCIWWHISHNGLVFSCVCVSIGFCKKCILYYNFALGYLHFAKNSFLENFFGKLAKPWKEKSLWHIFCRNHFQPSFLNSQVANFVLGYLHFAKNSFLENFFW